LLRGVALRFQFAVMRGYRCLFSQMGKLLGQLQQDVINA
jgi:hypothetical protein